MKRNESIFYAALGVFISTLILQILANLEPNPLMIAPFCASLAIIFGLKHSPFARPKNIFWSYMLTGVISLLVETYAKVNIVTIALAAALALYLMDYFSVFHPPAAVIPFLVLTTFQSWWYLLNPLLAGTLYLMLVSKIHQKVIKKIAKTEEGK